MKVALITSVFMPVLLSSTVWAQSDTLQEVEVVNANRKCIADAYKVFESCSPSSTSNMGLIQALSGAIVPVEGSAISVLGNAEAKKHAQTASALSSEASKCSSLKNKYFSVMTAPIDANTQQVCPGPAQAPIALSCTAEVTSPMSCATWNSIVAGSAKLNTKVSKDIATLTTHAGTATKLSGDYINLRNKALLIGGGVAATGIAYKMYDDHKDHKKDEKRNKKAAEDFNNGVITDGEGNRVQCFSEAGYQKLDCRETMTRLCQQDDKATKGGCQAFNNNYCNGDGAGTTYCLSREAFAYCKQAGLNTRSPACQWNGGRPSLCKTDPENMECLYGGTADALNLACQNFPNDPLCKAHMSGRIVTIGGSTPRPIGESSSSSMTDVAGASGSTDQASTSTDDLLPQTASLWNVSSSQVSNNCAAGTLTGCN